MKYVKLFQNHSKYNEFIGGQYLRPNISYCVNENHAHYTKYFLTPKQFVEYRYSFLKSLSQKFYTYRKQHMDVNKSEYENLCVNYTRKKQEELYKKGLRYGFNTIDNYNFSWAVFTNIVNNSTTIDASVGCDLKLGLRIDNNSHYLIGDASLYKTDEIYNGNDVFYILWIDAYEYDYEDETDAMYAIIEEAMYGDSIVLLCPHNTYANFTIAYPDGNGGYITAKPSSLTWTPAITYDTIPPNTEWISLFLFSAEDESINTRVDNVVTTMRTDFRKWYNADFSDLSVLDDIKLEFPKDIYNFIVNPWIYLDEDAMFNGPWN